MFSIFIVSFCDSYMYHPAQNRIYVPSRNEEFPSENDVEKGMGSFLRYCVLIIAGPIIHWTHYKLLKNNRGGVIYKTLKAYFKRCHWLVGICTVDLAFPIIYNISGSQDESMIYRGLYSLMVVLEIYIMVALIKIRDIYLPSDHEESTTAGTTKFQAANFER